LIAQVRKKKPESYLIGVLSLLPKQSQVEKLSPFSELSDAELDQLERYLAAARVQTVTELELQAANAAPAVQPTAVVADEQEQKRELVDRVQLGRPD
jgi:hypothetical protein